MVDLLAKHNSRPHGTKTANTHLADDSIFNSMIHFLRVKFRNYVCIDLVAILVYHKPTSKARRQPEKCLATPLVTKLNLCLNKKPTIPTFPIF